MKIVATTFTGLEEVLKQEIEALGGKNIRVTKRAVTFFGQKDLLYRSNLLLRTALRILVPITDFLAADAQTLYEKVYEIDWTRLFDVDKTFAVESVVYSNIYKHSGFVSLKVKDAIVDRFREHYGYRPNVDNKQPQIKINVHVNGDFFTISLDSSGEPLFKRGYRVEQTKAPMNEVLAAGLIKLSGWDMKTDFMDFMCGSGTLPIEAALLATNTPSQFKRTYFAFKHWKNYDKALWDSIKDQEMSKVKNDIKIRIYASDISAKAIRTALSNAESAGIDKLINFRTTAFQDLRQPKRQKHIIVNPPYGLRLTGDLRRLYNELGQTLKKKFSGSQAWVFTNNQQLLSYINLKPRKKYRIKTGSIDGYFYQYLIF